MRNPGAEILNKIVLIFSARLILYAADLEMIKKLLGVSL